MSELHARLLDGDGDPGASPSDRVSLQDFGRHNSSNITSTDPADEVLQMKRNRSVKSVNMEGQHEKTLEWYNASVMVVAIILGLGVLGLPWAFSTMGWILAFVILSLSTVGATYSGITITKLVHAIGQNQAAPKAYSELGQVCFGNKGRLVVGGVQVVYLAGIIIAVQLTAATAFRQMVRGCGGSVCIVTANLVIAAMVLPVMQVKSLREVTWVAVLGVCMIIGPLIIYMTEIDHPAKDTPTSAGFPDTSGFDPFANGLTTIIFAYQGQTIFPELIAQMPRPEDFSKAVYSSVLFMTFVYALVGSIGYSFLGSSAEYLQDYVDQRDGLKASTTVANGMLIFHVLAGYVINGNVMNHKIHEALHKRGKTISHPKVAWAAVTGMTVAVSFVVANLIPFLQDLLSVLGATCGFALTFVFPASFALKYLGSQLSLVDKCVHWFVLVVSIVCMGVGSYATIKSLVEKIEHSAVPFEC
eukprot:m.487943 g.487943  ORF g.487943 m.487943 type:complete len:472 (-) comp25381_c0_seq1:122-1537(-)